MPSRSKENSHKVLRTYSVKHRRDFSSLLESAKHVANYAAAHKFTPKLLSTKMVKHFGLPSDVSNQILRKYGRGTIRSVKSANLIVPNTLRKNKLKNQTKTYSNIVWDPLKKTVTVKPLKLRFRWNPSLPFTRIVYMEINKSRYFVTVAVPPNPPEIKEELGVLGIDHNCGVGRAILNCADLKKGTTFGLGKKGPKIRLKYRKKRKKQKIKGNKEHRIMKDLDHKISRRVVNYALKNKLRIVLENLQGIRKRARKGKRSKAANGVVNSWSFYRLQSFIEYKAKKLGIPVVKVSPEYTSQDCSYCGARGHRCREKFVCRNNQCTKRDVVRNSDVNAAFNIGKRALKQCA